MCVTESTYECVCVVNSDYAVPASKYNDMTVMLPINKQIPTSFIIYICSGKHNDVLAWPSFPLCCSLVMVAQGKTYPYERLREACSDLPGLGPG